MLELAPSTRLNSPPIALTPPQVPARKIRPVFTSPQRVEFGVCHITESATMQKRQGGRRQVREERHADDGSDGPGRVEAFGEQPRYWASFVGRKAWSFSPSLADIAHRAPGKNDKSKNVSSTGLACRICIACFGRCEPI
jgi:hypothetical protein